MSSALYTKLLGTSELSFEIGLTGPKVVNNSGALEAKNAAASGFVVVRGADPVTLDDLATKRYVDSSKSFCLVYRQADCTSAIPNNTTVEGFVVVTTAGTGAAIGDLLWDNGLNDSLPMTIQAAVANRSIATKSAFGGGTISFDADSIYSWNDDGSAWVKIGDIGSVTGAVREIRYAITNAAGAQDSTAKIPANARVTYCGVEITTAFSGGKTISVGQAGNVALLQATTDNNPQVATDTIFSVNQDTAWGASDLVVRTTVTGAGAAGAGFVVVRYTVTNV